MFSLNVGCIIVNGFFVRNLTQMISRPNRARGTTKCVHYVALASAVLACLLLIAMSVAAFFPSQVRLFQRLQDGYFGVQILVQMTLLIVAIGCQQVQGQLRNSFTVTVSTHPS